LGDCVKCGDILAELLSAKPTIVLLQETKLANITRTKLRSFLPSRLDAFNYVPASGTSGGILTAWSTNAFTCLGTHTSPHSFSFHLQSTSTIATLFITNIYAPSPDLRSSFLDENKSLSPPPNTPWMLAEDFNMIRYSHEKNNSNFHVLEAESFNDCIKDLYLLELPLLDRRYTWSNRRIIPTHERLDRVFINLVWDENLPNSILSSLT
jgi:hypothetical protein